MNNSSIRALATKSGNNVGNELLGNEIVPRIKLGKPIRSDECYLAVREIKPPLLERREATMQEVTNNLFLRKVATAGAFRAVFPGVDPHLFFMSQIHEFTGGKLPVTPPYGVDDFIDIKIEAVAV